jgi:hypothetical protein
MATFKNGILGGMSGKIGPVVLYKRMTIDCARSKPKPKPKGKRKKPGTPKQEMARAKFIFLNNWLKKSTPLMAAGFANYQVNLTGMQAAYSCNVKSVLGTSPNLSFDYTTLRISTGEMPAPEAKVEVSTAGYMDLSWTFDPLDNRIMANDQAMVMLWFAEDEEAVYTIHGSLRCECRFVIGVPERLSGKSAEVYLAFRSDDRKRNSESCYLGTVIAV